MLNQYTATVLAIYCEYAHSFHAELALCVETSQKRSKFSLKIVP